jgi:hypothetical protein
MQSTAIICIRALGAFVAAANMGIFATLLSTQLSLEDFGRSGVSVPLIAPAVVIVLGIAMVIWSRSLSALLMSGLEVPPASAMGAQQLLQVGTALLALFFLATAISDVVAAIWDYFRDQPSDREAVAEMQRQRAISYALKAATNAGIGALLLWMARGVFARERAA